ncbi:MAG: AMP-binding protein, partial [Gammaproteobacteria bacterium]|nr:AMP-binding protein [Gammaproteobacteria bacterium]
METWTKDVIPLANIVTLHDLFLERVQRSQDDVAYRYFCNKTHKWQSYTWNQAHQHILNWRKALRHTGLSAGQSVGLMLRNRPEWIFCEQACMAEGLISVPLYPNDRPDNVSFIINEAEIKLILVESSQQADIVAAAETDIESDLQLIHLENINTSFQKISVLLASQWLGEGQAQELNDTHKTTDTNQLATIVYTSGTTGRPKGVMLSHKNILSNANSGISAITVYREDLFLSFLPLSHTLERTVGYYITVLTGACVAFCRSIPQLAEDLLIIRPTIIISVPRIYERV